MANFQGSARSNYFAVRDEKEFREWADTRHLEVVQGASDEFPVLFCLLARDADNGVWPTFDWEGNDINLADEVAQHLAPGHVAILMGVGGEKLCYLMGHATAVNSDFQPEPTEDEPDDAQPGMSLGQIAEAMAAGKTVCYKSDCYEVRGHPNDLRIFCVPTGHMTGITIEHEDKDFFVKKGV